MNKKGRPSRPPTDAEKQKVKELVALKAPIGDIAIALKRSVPNLKKYFSAQLIFPKKNKTAAPLKITTKDREKVIRYIGCKMTTADVARVLDITEDQLTEHFGEEIRTGQAKFRAKVLDQLDEQMADGLVGATNRLEAITVIPEEGDSPTARTGPNVGKKAAEKSAAGAAVVGGGRFAPRPAPKLAVDNT